MPATDKHARTLNSMCDELRDLTTLTRKCGHCNYTITGTVADTNAPMLAHLRSVHNIIPKPRKKGRFAAETRVEDNIAKARAAGSAVDYHEHDAA